MVNRPVFLFLVVLAGLMAALILVSCGVGDSAGAMSESQPTSGPAGHRLAVLQTRRCPTELSVRVSRPPLPVTVRTAIPPSFAQGLVAYRDAAGTTLIAPKGWECEAGIGSDHSERVSAFPPGHENPAEPPFFPGQVVSLQLFTACKRCIAEGVCALFPKAGIVTKYGTLGGPSCPPGGLHEQVTRISPETAIFADPPGIEGTGTGSGGRAASFGALSFSEASGVRKVSCTLSSAPDHLCARMVGATMVATAPSQ